MTSVVVVASVVPGAPTVLVVQLWHGLVISVVMVDVYVCVVTEPSVVRVDVQRTVLRLLAVTVELRPELGVVAEDADEMEVAELAALVKELADEEAEREAAEPLLAALLAVEEEDGGDTADEDEDETTTTTGDDTEEVAAEVATEELAHVVDTTIRFLFL